MARQTSAIALQAIEASGLLSKMRFEVYKALFALGPCTAQELVGQMGYDHAEKRLSELRDRGVVVEIGQGVCKETRHLAILWDVTANMPVEPGRKKTSSQLKIERLEAENTTLRERLALMEIVTDD